MKIRTKTTTLNEETRKETLSDYFFDLFSVEDCNSDDEGYAVITLSSTGNRVNLKIKFNTLWKLIEENNLKCKTIIE